MSHWVPWSIILTLAMSWLRLICFTWVLSHCSKQFHPGILFLSSNLCIFVSKWHCQLETANKNSQNGHHQGAVAGNETFLQVERASLPNFTQDHTTSNRLPRCKPILSDSATSWIAKVKMRLQLGDIFWNESKRNTTLVWMVEGGWGNYACVPSTLGKWHVILYNIT